MYKIPIGQVAQFVTPATAIGDRRVIAELGHPATNALSLPLLELVMSDEAKRLALVKMLAPYLDQQDCYQPAPLVPLEMFFEGNDESGSLGCNLPRHPGIAAFHETLLELRSDPMVSGVWVLAKQHDWKPAWPHSDEILIRTRLNADDIAARLDHLEPDTVDPVTLHDVVKDVVGMSAICAPGERHVVVWWD